MLNRYLVSGAQEVVSRTKELDMKHTVIIIFSAILLCCACSNLWADTYLVGPGKTYTKLQDVADLLKPGDIVQVDGNATYPANANLSQSGTANNWITINGIKPAGGTRPVITGAGAYGINITGDYMVFQGFEINGGPKGIGVFGDNIKVRGCVIHGCNHGLIGYGTGTGNVTVEYCEFYGNGVPTGGATQHQIYMATDEIAHPGSTFRLQYCYLHDGVEGDNVKTRSERNEIYYNWIELAGTSGHGMGLFAPDPSDNASVAVNTAREDADVVGNVVIQARNACARIGGDTPGYPTNGRYRFVNNTFILTSARGDAIRTFNTIETLEMYNNVVYGATAGADIRVVNDADGAWVHSPRSVAGANNWIVTGATMVPAAAEWTNTLRGSASPFANANAKDYHPGTNSPLINAGIAATPTIAAYPFPNPLFPPAYLPPQAALIDTGSAAHRPVEGTIDIGAFEASPQSVLNGSQGRYNRTALDLQGAGHADFKVYGADGRLVRSLSRNGAGMRVVRFSSGEKTVIQRKIIIK
jgi:hypothetical protein